jgi:hypothetical protein
MTRAAWPAAVVLLGVAAWIAVESCGWVAAEHRAIPLLDAWEFADDLRRADAGEYSLAGLWAQHNEHRIPVPRLLFFADARVTSWRGTLLLGAILLAQLAHAAAVARLVRRGGAGRPAVLAAFAFGVAALFAFVQVENLLWPFQVQFTGVFLLGTLALGAYATAGRNGARAALVASISALLATGTMANGLLLWPLLVLAGWLFARPRRELALLALAGALVWTAYLVGWTPVARHDDPTRSLADLPRVLAFAIGYLGNPLCQFGLWPSRLLGSLGLLLLALLLGRAIRARGGDPVADALALAAAFVFGTALLTGLGRINLAPAVELSSRYTTGGGAYWLLLGGAWLVRLRARAVATTAALLLLAVLALLLLAQQRRAFDGAIPWFERMDRATTASWLGLRDPAHSNLVYGADLGLERQPPRDEYLARARLAHWAGGAADLLGSPLPVAGDPLPGAVLVQEAVPGHERVLWLRGVAPESLRLLAVVDAGGIVRGLGLAGLAVPAGALPPGTRGFGAHVRLPAAGDHELRIVAVGAPAARPVGPEFRCRVP